MSTSGARLAQRIKTTYLKHKTLPSHNPTVMEQRLAKTGREEARADEESGTESISDEAPDFPPCCFRLTPKEAESLESGFG